MKKIETIADVGPELASDIQYLWDESDLTSEEIAVEARPTLRKMDHPIPLEIVWEILGGGYNYEDHQN